MPLIRNKVRRAMNSLGSKSSSISTIVKVVKFKPSTTEWPISIKLKTVDSRKTAYTALSYAYEADATPGIIVGSSSENTIPLPASKVSKSRTILCDGAPLDVSQDLWDVLLQLRRLDSTIPIWIDRLCIDFTSREDRAAYVNRMSYIYGNASHVIVWLGKKRKGTDDAVLCMRKLVNAIDWRKIPRDFSADFRDPATYGWLGMDRISIQQWNSIYIFCHAKWFTRLWPFYELASAKQALFLIGDCYMDYDFLMDFAMVLGMTGWLDNLSQMAAETHDDDAFGLTKMLGPVATLRSIPVWHPQHLDHVRWMKNEHGLSTEEERAWKFFELLLQSTERFNCHDPRDRILAPLAYARKAYANRPINSSWPVVDYGTSVETIFSHFSDMIQRHTHKPSILANMTYLTQLQEMTSRPDLSRGRSARRIPLD